MVRKVILLIMGDCAGGAVTRSIVLMKCLESVSAAEGSRRGAEVHGATLALENDFDAFCLYWFRSHEHDIAA